MNAQTNDSGTEPGKHLIRFGPFTADLDSQELLRGNARLVVPGQSFRILVLLLAKPGRLVTRDDMRRTLWPSDTFVDFDHGLSAAIRRLREALGDSADDPRYIETLPRRGYRFIGTIEEEKIGPISQTAAMPSPAPSAGQERPQGGMSLARRWLLFVAGFAAAAVLVISGFLVVRRPTRPSSTRDQTVAIPFTSNPGIETAPAFSPDGSRIAFAWSGSSDPRTPGYELYLKGFGSEAQVQLTHHPSKWISSAWSPDGTRIAFHRLAGSETGIYLVSAMGGPEKKIIATRTPYSVAASISWSPDGKWIAYSDQLANKPFDRMFRVSVETSEVIEFEHDAGCLHEASPTFSRDGQKIFYACVHSMYAGDIRSRPITGGTRTQESPITEPALKMELSGDGQYLVYYHGAAPPKVSILDLNHHSATPIDVPGDSSWPTLSVQGDKLAFSTDLSRTGIWRRDLSRPDAGAVNVMPSSRHQNSPQYSPDGKHIAFESKRDGDWGLWVSDPDGGNLVKVSGDVVGSGAPRWSPDGTKIAFDAVTSHPSSIYIVDISDGVPRKLQTDLADMKLPAWSHDGNWIYFVSDTEVGHTVYRCSAQGGKPERLPTDVNSTRPQESADGRFLYVTSREVDFQLQKIALGDPKARFEPEAAPQMLNWTLWQLTARGIYFVPHEAPRTMRFFDFATRKSRDVFTLDRDFDDGISVSPDGRYMLYSQSDEVNADIMVMDKYH